MKVPDAIQRQRSGRCTVVRSIRRAFTLLELLLAIGLTSILMIALFSAMDIYFNLQLDGHEEITRQQIARTLLRQMTRDIQSVVFVKQETLDEDDSSSGSSSTGSSSATSTGSSSGTSSSSTSGSTTGGSTSGTGSSTGSAAGSNTSGSTGSSSSSTGTASYGTSGTADTTSAAMTTYTNGIVGTSTDLLLYISRPDRNMSYVSAQSLSSLTDRTSDLMIVRYLVADTTAGGISGDIAEQFAGSDNGPIGLVRITGDLYGLSTAVQEGEESASLVDQIDAKEVSALQFRYFDGLNWQESWDSTQLNQLPTAIEIVLTLRNTQSASAALSDEDDPYALGETTHRMIVAFPTAEPFIAETAL